MLMLITGRTPQTFAEAKGVSFLGVGHAVAGWPTLRAPTVAPRGASSSGLPRRHCDFERTYGWNSCPLTPRGDGRCVFANQWDRAIRGSIPGEKDHVWNPNVTIRPSAIAPGPSPGSRMSRFPI
jgi:hypothetical protein